MTPERWQQVDKLLEQALEREPSKRAVFLEDACNGDEVLRQEVESLLAAHERAGSLLSSPALKAADQQTESARDLIGRTLSHYQIVSRLGAGGMGVVYKARDTHLDRFVAIKVLPPELVADPDRKRRFVQEAKAASALNHPNIITIHDIASENSRDFIVMEYVQGKTLDQVIPRRGMSPPEMLRVAIQIADALTAAHAAGIIHRDLKPGNIMVGEGGLVKVLDFGLAKLTERSEVRKDEATGTTSPRTDEGMIVGTPSYMSPEQAVGKPVDARTDVFSFGSVLYEMVTGQRAFQADSKMPTLAAVLTQEPRRASELSRSLPRDLDKVITRCLRKEPNRRFQHMDDLKVALEELKEESDSGTHAVQTAGSARTPWRVSRLQWLAFVVAAASLAVAGWFWSGRSLSQKEPTVVPLTSYPGWESSPSFSPDGNQVAFQWSKPEVGSDIYVKQIGVEDPFRLTNNPLPDINPAWSPDGRFIAFSRFLPSNQAAALGPNQTVAYLVMPQRGGQERTITELDISAAGLITVSPKCAWTPDSKSLVVGGLDASRQVGALFLVSLDTGEKRKLTDPPSRFIDGDPAISPDGRVLVFVRTDQRLLGQLYRLDLSEDLKPQGQPERLIFDNRWHETPTWSLDGREILFASGNLYGALRLSRIAASRSAQPRRLPFAAEGTGNPAVSRQGDRLAYSVERRDPNIWRIDLPSPNAKLKEAVKFIASTRGEAEPAYSPDGQRIAFSSNRSGPFEIWVCDGDGSHPVRLTSFGGPFVNRPRWSPDGRRIVFYSDASGNRDIYVIRADGGSPKPLTKEPSIDENPGWSADGKWVYFQSDRRAPKEIWKVPADGGEAVPVRKIRESQPVESPDGKFLYYDKGWPDNYSIWRVPTNGGAETQVAALVHPFGGWVVFNDGVYFIGWDENGNCIRFKNHATGSIRTIATIRGQVRWGLTVSPDRRSFLYTQLDDAGSDLMLVENFR
jgi:serine/threonine protein kinase/sugar lactone lactonase YvrE